MATSATPKLSRAEQRRQQTLERRRQNAVEVVDAHAGSLSPQLSFPAQAMSRMLPAALVGRGLIAFDHYLVNSGHG